VLVVWAVIAQVEPSKHCEAEGSHQREQWVLFCVCVSGEAFVLSVLIVCLFLYKAIDNMNCIYIVQDWNNGTFVFTGSHSFL